MASLFTVMQTFGVIGTGIHTAAYAAGYFAAVGLFTAASGTAIGLGIFSAVTSEAFTKSKPVGITLTKSGLFSYHTLINSALGLNVDDKEGLPMPNIREGQETATETYFFESYRAMYPDIGVIENEHPGIFGGIKGFSAIHRSFLLHYFAVNVLSRTQRLPFLN